MKGKILTVKEIYKMVNKSFKKKVGTILMAASMMVMSVTQAWAASPISLEVLERASSTDDSKSFNLIANGAKVGVTSVGIGPHVAFGKIVTYNPINGYTERIQLATVYHYSSNPAALYINNSSVEGTVSGNTAYCTCRGTAQQYIDLATSTAILKSGNEVVWSNSQTAK